MDQLLERLGRQRFVAVVGTSGCGKSSLVHAGLIPALGTGLLGSAGARWAVATMRPGDRPLWRLAQALLNPAVLGPAWSDLEHPVAQLHAMLQRGPLGLAEVLDESPLTGGRKLLLLVDQFEELFRYRREGEGQRDEANAFVSLLLASARAPEATRLRRPDDAVRLPGRLRALRRAARGAQRQPVPDTEAHPRPATAGD